MGRAEFLADALREAVTLELASAADILRHATPEVLAESLPRSLWGRLLTALVESPQVEPATVLETLSIETLADVLPAEVMWGCVQEIARRSLGASTGLVAAVRGEPARGDFSDRDTTAIAELPAVERKADPGRARGAESRTEVAAAPGAALRNLSAPAGRKPQAPAPPAARFRSASVVPRRQVQSEAERQIDAVLDALDDES